MNKKRNEMELRKEQKSEQNKNKPTLVTQFLSIVLARPQHPDSSHMFHLILGAYTYYFCLASRWGIEWSAPGYQLVPP